MSPVTGDDVVYARADDLAWVEDDVRVTVLRLRDLAAEPLLLDGSAAEVWLRLEAPVALGALVDDLAHDFASDPAAVRGDVAAFVADAVAAGLVRRLGPGA